MIDILNLRNGMENNLLLIQQIHLMIQKEGEELKGFNDIIHAAQQHIDSISTLYTLGVSWLKGETDFALSFVQVVVDEESLEPDNFSEDQDLSVHENIGDIEDIKIEMEELENTVNKDLEDIKEEAEITGLKQEMLVKDSKIKRTTRRKDKNNKIRNFSCDLCDYVTSKKIRLADHKLVKHQGHRYFCDQCESSFTDNRNLRRHLKDLHEGQKYHCTECDYFATSQTQLKHHKDSVHLGLQYPCDSCEYVSNSKYNLRKHKITQHSQGEGSLSNEERPKIPRSRRRNENVSGGIQYSCDQCDSVSFSKVSMKLHKQRHVNQFLCDQCPYISKTKSDLKKHKLVKHEGLGFPCDLCKYVGQDKVHLRLHKEAVHMGIKYQCDQCEFAASTNGNLREHIACKHDDTNYPCDHCGHVSTTLNAKKKHMKSKHPLVA
ncbi:zinc finger protein 665 isoform X2 [Eurytemora carolleeae]|nr:zinc finger protein 665 isoform X2 [Eurytemora carolleeae]|eukprot:XP_023332288.1 zinc finger protein 665-like isoform X2 [Eurytemora affinis]